MTKERLRQYQQLKREATMLEEKLVELESAMTSPRIQKLDGMPQGQPQGGSLMDLLVEQHLTLKAVYANKLRELNDTLLDIETAIESLTDSTERNLMRLKYIEGLTWEKVCVEIGYEWSQTHRKHARALERLRSKEDEAREDEAREDDEDARWAEYIQRGLVEGFDKPCPGDKQLLIRAAKKLQALAKAEDIEEPDPCEGCDCDDCLECRYGDDY